MARETIGASLHSDKAPAAARLKNMVPVQVTTAGVTHWVWREGANPSGRFRRHVGGEMLLDVGATTGRSHMEVPSGSVLTAQGTDNALLRYRAGTGGYTLSRGSTAVYVLFDDSPLLTYEPLDGGYTFSRGSTATYVEQT